MTRLHVIDVQVEALIPAARNSRTHSPDQISAIAGSIREFGFTNPVLMDGARGIIAGHGRVLAARKLGMAAVPCIELGYLTETQKRAYILADNKLALNAGWDVEMLASELQGLVDEDFDIDVIGFSGDELSALLADKTEGLTDPDEVPEVPAEPVSVVGDVWVMGRHRVMCGDSVAITDVERLLNGTNADMVFTDPPYGINAVKGGRVGSIGGASPFGGKKGRVHGEYSKAMIPPGEYAPVIGDSSTQTAIDSYNLCAGLNIPVMVFWGGNYYADALPPSKCWLVWDKENTGQFADAELAWTNADKPVRLFRHMWNGLMKASERGERRVHPTQKPAALAEWAFGVLGKDGDRVLDLFGGSASTLIACERTNRVAFLMELSPAYVDVAVTRWQNFTGQQATLESDGRTFDEIAGSRVTPD